MVLVSTSGGSGGNAGAADFAAHAGALLAGGGAPGAGEGSEGGDAGTSAGGGAPLDAALVLGDMAGARVRGPLVGVLSGGAATAPALLQNTVAAALAQQAGVAAAAPSTLAQLAHLVFPLPAGEQAPLDARGLPAVQLGVGGENPPPADEPVSAARLEAFGRAALAAVYALDPAPSGAGGPQGSAGGGEAGGGRPPAGGAEPGGAASAAGTAVGGVEAGLPLHSKTVPGWALRLLVAALLLPALLALCDGLARLRRRGERVGRWVVWTLTCALPFLAAALFTILLGALGAFPAPRPPVSPAALPFDGAAVETTLASALVLLLAWLTWPALVRRLGLPGRPAAVDAATLSPLLVLAALAAVAWVLAPLTALLLVPALHAWLLLTLPPPPRPGRAAPGRAGGRSVAATLGLLALGVAPLVALVAFYAAHLHLGVGGVVHTALLLLAGGRVGVLGAAGWSVACGGVVAVGAVALARRPADTAGGEPREWEAHEPPIRIRGPLSYAGPGSLGGTKSALRR